MIQQIVVIVMLASIVVELYVVCSYLATTVTLLRKDQNEKERK